MRQLGSEGDAEGQLYCPVGLAVDDKGDVIVADADNQRIQVFR